MSVFTTSRRYQIDSVISGLARRLVNSAKNEVTHDDVIQCFIKPEHRQMAVTMNDLFGLNGPTAFAFAHAYKGPNSVGVQLAVNFGPDDVRFSIPNYASNGVLPDAPEESLKRINNWVRRRIALGREFGQASDVFDLLCDKCVSARAVAFLMPTVAALVAQIPDDDGRLKVAKFHDTLTRTGQPPLPMLNPEIREAVELAQGSFARALLISSEAETTKTLPVNLTISSVPSVKNPWGTTQTFI